MPDHVITTDISNVSKAYAILGGFIVIYGLMSYVAKDRLYMSEALIAVTLGIVTGPYVLGWIDPLSWGTTADTDYVTYELTRLVVGVQVLFTGITMPKAYLRREALSLLVLLGAVMTCTWFVSALLIWGLIPNLTYLESLAIAAAITPTDPVLSSSIIKGRFAERYLPVSLRNIILAESGANDGLGFPFLFIALYLLARTGEDRGTSVGTEIGRWVYGVVVYRVILSCVYGALVGYLAHKTLKWAELRGYIDRDNFFAYGFGLALFTLGTTGLFNSDDILACYVAGNAFTWKDWYRVRTQVEEQDSFQDIIDSLLNAAVFIYIGAIIPWADYNTAYEVVNIAPWRIVLLGITVMVLRRLPWVMAFYKLIPAIENASEALFAGWFGPIGVAAVFYIQIALREIPDDGTRDRLRAVYTPVVMFCVFSSVLVHGITIPLVKLGPTIVRRTTSFSQRRTISLTTKPTREATLNESSAQAGGAGTDPAVTKLVWNPFYAFADALKSVFLFWRKDSIWRRENAHLREQRRVLQADNISRPVRAVRRASIHEDEDDEVDTSDGDSEGTQARSADAGPDERESDSQEDKALSGSDTDTAAIEKPQPTANIKDKQVNRTSTTDGTTEANGEKDETDQDKATSDTMRLPAVAPSAQASIYGNLSMSRTNTTSGPSTPIASRVRFH